MLARSTTAWPRGGSVALLASLLLGACASAPNGDAAGAARHVPALPSESDGPGADPPADLARLPDAEPRIEALRSGGPNKPYQAFGHDYVPIVADDAFRERGLASWYGRKFNGRPTASGEPYDMYAMTAAHPTLPIPSYARITNPANGRAVVVRVNDRGPFRGGRIVDLSYAAALKLGVLRNVATVEVRRITFDEIRAGSWRRNADAVAAPVLAAAPTANGAASQALPEAPGATRFAAAGETLAGSIRASEATTSAALPAPAPVAEPAAAAARAGEAGAGAEPAEAEVPRAAPAMADAAGAGATPAAGLWLQLGAFRDPQGAARWRRRAAAEAGWLSPLLATFIDAALWRVQAGPYPTRLDAEAAAARIRAALGVAPMLVERR